MWITIALLLASSRVFAHDAATELHSTGLKTQHNATSGASQQEAWAPMTSKQDGANNYPYQQVVAAYGYQQVPAPGEVVNTTPLNVQDANVMLQQAGSGVVLQIHPQYLKGYPNQHPQNIKQIQGDPNLGHGYHRNPQVAATLQVQPPFVVAGVSNQDLLHKQLQAAPIYYNQAPLNYQTQLLGGVKPGQQLLAAPLHQHQNPNVLAQFAVAQYPQAFQTNQHVNLLNHPSGAKLGAGKVQSFGALNLNGFVQHPVVKPVGGVVYGQTKETPVAKLRGNLRDTSNDEVFPDFGKMFESYFKTGPFGQSFKNDNPENGEEINPKLNTNDDFPTGDFFGDAVKSQASIKQPQEEDGEFQPCKFFKAANLKVAEDDDDDSEQFSSNKAREQNRPNNYFSPSGGERQQHRSNDDNEESPNRNYPRLGNNPNSNRFGPPDAERHRGNRDDDEDNSDKSSSNQRPGYSHRHEERRPNRHQQDDDDDEEEDEHSHRQHHKHRPSQSQRSEQRPHHSYNRDGYGKESNRNNNNNNSDDDDRRQANFHHSVGGHSGGPSSVRNYDGSFTGRPSNQHKVNRPNHEENRPSYNHHNEDDYSHHGRPGRPNSDEDTREHRGRPSNDYRQDQPPHRENQGAGPNGKNKSNAPVVKTFHQYNFPPAPDYARDVEEAAKETRNQRNHNNQNSQKRRPPAPVKEQEADTLGYYSHATPVVGKSDIYYRSEKQLIARNNSAIQ